MYVQQGPDEFRQKSPKPYTYSAALRLPPYGGTLQRKHATPPLLSTFSRGGNRLFCNAYTIKVCNARDTSQSETDFLLGSTYYFDQLYWVKGAPKIYTEHYYQFLQGLSPNQDQKVLNPSRWLDLSLDTFICANCQCDRYLNL